MAASIAIAFADDRAKVFTALEESLTVTEQPESQTAARRPSPEVKVLATDISLDETSDLLITPSLITASLTRTENDGAKGHSKNARALETINIVVRVEVSPPGRAQWSTTASLTRSSRSSGERFPA